jgi:GT2 family glycosyltransferase
MDDAAVDVSVIIASYNTRELLASNLRSILDKPPRCALEVIVSDDASSDGSPAMVREQFPQVVLRVNDSNSGYAETNNRAIAIARGRYVYLLNCDAQVVPGALDRLVEFMDAHPKAGAAGTLIFNENGTVQASVKALPTIRSAFVGKRSWIYRWFPNSPLVRSELLVTEARPETPPFQAGYVSSASVILPRAVCERVGKWDPRLWWFVDADYCKRIHDLGYEVWCVPSAQIIHLDHRGGTVRGRRRRFWAIYKFHEGAWIYWRQYSGHGLAHPATWFAAAALFGRAALSTVIQIGKEIVGREDRY